jgi:hypothetical protein
MRSNTLMSIVQNYELFKHPLKNKQPRIEIITQRQQNVNKRQRLRSRNDAES